VERVKNFRPVLVVAALASLLIATPSRGCVKVQSHVKVSMNLVVSVHDPAGKPLSGMEIHAFKFIPKPPHTEVAASAVTDKNGKAEIKLAFENYSLEATHSGVSSEIALIDTFDDGSGTSEIVLTWPGGPVTEIQRVSGVLGEGRGRVPWVGAEIVLKSSKGDVGKEVTDSQGRFEFRGIAPGFYALHISEPHASQDSPYRVEGDVPIRVNEDAPNHELPTWGFVMSDCGLAAYKDASSMIIFGP
jgi:hypothetical protein